MEYFNFLYIAFFATIGAIVAYQLFLGLRVVFLVLFAFTCFLFAELVGMKTEGHSFKTAFVNAVKTTFSEIKEKLQ